MITFDKLFSNYKAFFFSLWTIGCYWEIWNDCEDVSKDLEWISERSLAYDYDFCINKLLLELAVLFGFLSWGDNEKLVLVEYLDYLM